MPNQVTNPKCQLSCQNYPKKPKTVKGCQTSTLKQKAENLEDMQRKAKIASKISKNVFHHFPAKRTFSERKYSKQYNMLFLIESGKREREEV